MTSDMRAAPGAKCSATGCPYEEPAYSLDPDGLCLNCSDDREREHIEMDTEIRQDVVLMAA